MSSNYKARTVNLKTHDVETAGYGSGHVLAEVWLSEHKKWALIDAQFNIMPILNDVPLNIVELQQAIRVSKKFKFIDTEGEVSKSRRKQYVSFLPHSVSTKYRYGIRQKLELCLAKSTYALQYNLNIGRVKSTDRRCYGVLIIFNGPRQKRGRPCDSSKQMSVDMFVSTPTDNKASSLG